MVRSAYWLGLTVLLTGMLALGWDRGMDVVIDFGRELYVPWRLVEGDVLHRDIAWFNGPLAPWLIEGWMRLFGVSLDALQALNAALIAVATWFIVRLLSRMSDAWTAWVGAGVFLTVFAVSRQEATGSYHFLSPYSHGLTVGLVASLAAIDALDRRRFLLAGAALGAVFLTKAEVSLAAIAAASVMLALGVLDPMRHRRQARSTAAAAAGFALVIALAAARFHLQLAGEGVGRALLGTWPHALDASVRDLPLYREMRGTSDVAASALRIAKFTAGLLALVAVLVAGCGPLGRRWPKGGPAFAAALGAIATAGVLAFAPIKWAMLPITPLVLVATVACGWRALAAVRGADERCAKGRDRRILLAGWLTFSAALLPKVLLQPIPRQYGFALALPGALALVMLLVHWIPMRQQSRWTVAAAMSGMLAVFSLASVYSSYGRFSQKSVEVGVDRDRMYADGHRGTVMRAVLAELEERLAPDEPFLVLPEGVLLNYQLRRRTPTRLVNFMPPELMFFDEAAIIEGLEVDPPRHIVLLHRPTDVYGFPFLGDGYGEELMRWVLAHYRRAEPIGHRPSVPGGPGDFGAEILTLAQ